MSTGPENPISDADVEALPVQDALDDLLAELVAAPEAAGVRDAVPTAHPRRRWPLVAAAAAAVVVVAAVPAYLLRSDDGGPTPPVDPGSAASSAEPTTATTTAPTVPSPPPGPQLPAPGDWTGPSSYAALEAPGWTVDAAGVTTDADYGVSVTYVNGGRYLTLEWTRAHWYRSVLESAEAEGPSSTIQVLGQEARYFVYESEQQMAYLPVVDGYGLRVDASFTSPAEFQGLVALLRVADEVRFAALLPDEVVAPAETADAVLDLMRGVDAPPLRLPTAGYNSRYAIANEIVGAVGCAWTERWVEARADGDEPGRERALAALEGSTSWPVLTDVLESPDWFADLTRLMREDAPDRRVRGAGCAATSLSSSID